MEPGFVRIQLPASADLQAIRHGLFRYPKAAVGARIHDVPIQIFLVAIAGWKPPAHLLSSRLRGGDRCRPCCDRCFDLDASYLREESDGPTRDDVLVRRGRPRWRAHPYHAGPCGAIEGSRHGLSEAGA